MEDTGSVRPGSPRLVYMLNAPIDFSNTLSKSQIEEMATADEFEAVKEVQEFFADYLAHYPSLFTLTQASLADGGDGPSNVSLVWLYCAAKLTFP